MDPARALEYLLLGPDEKINYRAERGLSLKEWYDSFTPEPSGKGAFRRKEVAALFGLQPRRFKRLADAGVLGESEYRDHKRLFPADRIEALRQEKARLIPVRAFREVLKNERWYISPVNEFTKRFGDLYDFFLESKYPSISFPNAARITQQMRLRKAMVEEWATLDDLNEQSGMNLSRSDRKNRYLKMVNAGELQAVKVGMYDTNGNWIGGTRYVIPPTEFKRVLKREKRVAHALRVGVDKKELAARLGISESHASNLMRTGEITGLLHPIHVGFTDGQSMRYRMLLPDEADALVAGRIKVPSHKRIYRLQNALSPQEFQREFQNEAARAHASVNGLTTSEIAAEMGRGAGYVAKVVRHAADLGLISPLADSYDALGRGSRRFYISAEDARALIDGTIKVPSSMNAQKMKSYAELANETLEPFLPQFEQDLWKRVQEGDNTAYPIISQMYASVLDHLAKRGRFGSSFEDRREQLESALFEVVAEQRAGLRREAVLHLLERKLAEMVKVERPSWVSLDRILSSDGSLVPINSVTRDDLPW